jgi:hypothetical protein
LFKDLSDIYNTLCVFNANHAERTVYAQFRGKYLQPTMLVKTAFDSRRVNQNTEFNPRRNLQYYQRSEPFIDNQSAEQVQTFLKVKAAIDDLRQEFIGEPDWLDSLTRILCNAVDQTLRVDQKDFDYSREQLNYLTELLYVRYRLSPEDIQKSSHHELKNIILNKDEKLAKRSIFINYKQDFNKMSVNQPSNLYNNAAFDTRPVIVKQQDDLMEKLFGNTKASKDNKEVERTVSITIKDKIIDPIVKDAGGANEEIVKGIDGADDIKKG